MILGNGRQNLGEQKLGVIAAKRVVLEAAVLGLWPPAAFRRQLRFLMPWIDKHADRHGHLALVNEIVEHDGHAEIAVFIGKHGELLARAATSGVRMPDELKGRILSAFLTLMNLRENMDRAVERARSTATR